MTDPTADTSAIEAARSWLVNLSCSRDKRLATNAATVLSALKDSAADNARLTARVQELEMELYAVEMGDDL